MRWTRRLLLQALGVTVGLALLFAAVGFVEWATGRLLISNEKVLAANDLKPYFRVNSLFFDPNVYGRFLALVMVVLAGVLLWAPARRDVTRVAVALALLWAALVLTLSESSFAALLVGLAVLAALRWRTLAGGGGVRRRGRGRRWRSCVLAPGTLGLKTDSFSSVNEASSGRAKLIRGGREDGGRPAADGLRLGLVRRPLPRPRARRVLAPVGRVAHDPGHDRRPSRARSGSRRTASCCWTAFAVAFGGLRRTLRRRPAGVVLVARCVVAAAFCALLLHTLRLRGVPGGSADLDAARDGRGAAARGAGRRGGRRRRAPRAAPQPVPT